MNTRVAIVGATGYTAAELVKLLLRHPHVTLTAATSRQEGRPPLASVHPALQDRTELTLENLDPTQLAERADVVFSCLPHGQSATFVPRLLEAGCRVVDLSADYRLDDAAVYHDWYGQEHPDPTRLAETVYGLPELFRETIREARLVANPGCYPTSAILALAPLVRAGLLGERPIIVDSKSGVSGAGRGLKLTTHYPECNESVSAYGVGTHRHTPEIELLLSKVAQKSVEVIFTPHLIPMDRGILTTTYSEPHNAVDETELLDRFAQFYADEPFVRVVEHLPATKDSLDTNYCDITVRVVRGRVLTISCLDNLIKGASGAAVQNFNLMCGYPEATAL
ncbi:MAG: N-acetyl-gamma-glutamyl-phosphate reductase [Planctomycetota bacterium]|nr:MAG: N-acetyl-gamma-glutamyl-phosphate reductase [Planctomycetota bacterium]REK49112.1 MAG: N-acetyl-gamma-glutamyl-phosphate reductase [Planctomycetota bacterium]